MLCRMPGPQWTHLSLLTCSFLSPFTWSISPRFHFYPIWVHHCFIVSSLFLFPDASSGKCFSEGGSDEACSSSGWLAGDSWHCGVSQDSLSWQGPGWWEGRLWRGVESGCAMGGEAGQSAASPQAHADLELRPHRRPPLSAVTPARPVDPFPAQTLCIFLFCYFPSSESPFVHCLFPLLFSLDLFPALLCPLPTPKLSPSHSHSLSFVHLLVSRGFCIFPFLPLHFTVCSLLGLLLSPAASTPLSTFLVPFHNFLSSPPLQPSPPSSAPLPPFSLHLPTPVLGPLPAVGPGLESLTLLPHRSAMASGCSTSGFRGPDVWLLQRPRSLW